METFVIHLPAKLATLITWINTRLDPAQGRKLTVPTKETFLSDLVFFSSEEEMAEYVNSFRGEE